MTTALVLGMGASASALSIDWGLTAGLNLTKVSYKSDQVFADNLKNKAGFFVGPKVNIGLIGGFGFDGALLYSQHNMQMIDSKYASLKKLDNSSTLHSIDVPINLKYTFGLGGTGVYVSTGPQFGFRVGDSKEDLGSALSGELFSNENMITTWNVGAGVKLLGHLDVGVGYNFALGNTGKFAAEQFGVPTGKGTNYKTNTFTAQVTYYF